MENLEDKKIGKKIRLIMEYLGLEIAGFELFTGVSTSHIYAIINGHRRLTIEIANQIGEKIGVEGWKILHIDYEIPSNISQNLNILNFRKEYSPVADYFINTKDERKKSHFINQLASSSNFFNEEKYVWQIRDKAKDANRDYSSKELSQILRTLYDKKILNRKIRQYRNRHGDVLERCVWVYFKE